MLAPETRQALHGMGVREKVEARVCSKCGRHSSTVDGEHPLDEQIRKVKKRLRAERGGSKWQEIDSRRHWLVSIRHRTSRCCGASYKDVVMNRQEAMWSRWLGRWDDVRAIVVPQISRKNPNLSEDELMKAAMRSSNCM